MKDVCKCGRAILAMGTFKLAMCLRCAVIMFKEAGFKTEMSDDELLEWADSFDTPAPSPDKGR